MRLWTSLPTILVALTFSAAMPGVTQAVDVPLAGRQMRLLDSSHPVGRRNLVGLLDPRIELSGVDPRVTGATISIGPVSGPATVLALPASGWTLTGNAPRIDFKYKSRTGAVEAARLADGQQIRFTARGQDAYALGGTPQGEVGVAIDIGSVRFCGSFGGTISRDDGLRFVARNAPAPASCPTFGVTTTTSTSTTTSTTTTTTSSSTTTTRPYSLVQNYTNKCVPFNYLDLFTGLSFASFDAAYASCVAECEATPGCVEIWVANDCTTGPTSSWCLIGAADPGPNATYGWTGQEIQCSYPPIPTCAGWYAVAQP